MTQIQMHASATISERVVSLTPWQDGVLAAFGNREVWQINTQGQATLFWATYHYSDLRQVTVSPFGIPVVTTIKGDVIFNSDSHFPYHLPVPGYPTQVVFSPSKKFMATASGRYVIIWPYAETGTAGFSIQPMVHHTIIAGVDFDPQDNLITLQQNGVLRRFHPDGGLISTTRSPKRVTAFSRVNEIFMLQVRRTRLIFGYVVVINVVSIFKKAKIVQRSHVCPQVSTMAISQLAMMMVPSGFGQPGR